MSGGFFRGTSADQDTRFSNKQAKLLKSQKFAPELDHLVNTRKVKMDIIKPWIANRVTELLGFEDEVLINFVYGLLDGKEVNGKEVQISLTGFMEKNTGKFMKELWTLLLSAGKNESGVPQQFLDAKEEETRKKQAEVDRIANEIQKKKVKEEESRELERERSKKMDDEVEKKANNAMEPASKHMLPKGSSGRAEDEKDTGTRNGAKGRKGSRRSIDHSFSSPIGSTSRISRSVSNSRSHSGHKSRSVSRSPEAQGRRSMSSDRVYRSPRRRSITPPRRRSSYSKHTFRHRSPSPVRRRLRSPFRRRSPSPLHDRSPVRRRRSPSPVRHCRSPSPVRHRRSPSPVRRRRSPSPIQHSRSPSPVRHRRSPSLIRRRKYPSPIRHGRSPLLVRHRRSPSLGRHISPSFVSRGSPSPIRRKSSPFMRRKSPSPVRRRYQRSPSTPHHMSPPIRHRSSVISRKRSPSPSLHRSPLPHESSSQAPEQHRSPSQGRSPKELKRSPIQSLGERVRSQQTLLPVPQRPSSSFRSQQRYQKDQKDLHARLPPLSPSPERSPPFGRKRSASEDRRSPSPYESPARQRRERVTPDGSLSPLQQRVRKPLKDSPESGKDHEETGYTREGGDYNSTSSHKRPLYPSNMEKQRDPPLKFHYKDEQSLERLASHQTTDSRNYPDNMDSRKKDQDIKIGKSSRRGGDQETLDAQKSPSLYKNEKDRSCLNHVKDSDKCRKSETVPVTAEKVHHSNGSGALDSGSEESGKHRGEKREKSKHKRSHRHEVALDDDGSHGSEIAERKETKRRRREEKKLRKEEKRRRHEERRRRRAERRAEKLKLKGRDDASSSDDEHVGRRESHPSDDEETESDQRRLEIELRKKALESLKAKKGTSH
ncbi:PREDICTED: serine/arginine repetitive matrix protein 1 isoform X2 [Populus euphratica]|uniref:Serine/arginine repetitive matrix protein 1 isoform X2 n=1 Tax=Populus euphratica TaxID=75702 RepID=A0AAJ6UTD2_POPEU|nr:PREDICTED: serine/arginine repetitive matrix protein 1 isoform X2 [Populus euphratica]